MVASIQLLGILLRFKHNIFIPIFVEVNIASELENISFEVGHCNRLLQINSNILFFKTIAVTDIDCESETVSFSIIFYNVLLTSFQYSMKNIKSTHYGPARRCVDLSHFILLIFIIRSGTVIQANCGYFDG